MRSLYLRKAKSLTPLITVSCEWLYAHDLWDNTIRLIQMRYFNNIRSYNRKVQLGENIKSLQLGEKNNVKDVKGNIIILLSSLKDWEIKGSIPEYIVTNSLSEGMGTDTYAILMVASNKSNVMHKGSKWSTQFTDKFEKLFRNMITKKGKHHESTGHYYGFGVIAKYNKVGKVLYSKVAMPKDTDQ